jgi:hypothetical protein
MAPIADPILLAAHGQTDHVLRWAESMPGVTYKTRIVKKKFTLTDLAEMRDNGGQSPSLYDLEAYDADFTAFYENLQRNSDGTLKGMGSNDSNGWGDPFMYDAHKHAGLPVVPPPTADDLQSWVFKDGKWSVDQDKRHKQEAEWRKAAKDTLDRHHLKPLITSPETVKPVDPCAQNTEKPKYEPMKSGVWVDTNFNEDDIIADPKGEAKEKIATALQDLVELIKNL